ncbi:MAG: hypothetical protein WDZ40_04565 [Candidatus Spechtbacterales bacterium]
MSKTDKKKEEKLGREILKIINTHKSTGWSFDKNGKTVNIGCKCGRRAHNLNPEDYFATTKSHNRHLVKVITNFVLTESP